MNVSKTRNNIYSYSKQADLTFSISSKKDQIVYPINCILHSDIYRFCLSTHHAELIIKSAIFKRTPALSPNGKWVVYAANTPNKPAHIFICSVNGKIVKPLAVSISATDWYPSFSTDGSQIVFVRGTLYRPYSIGGYKWDKWDVYTMRTDGTHVRRITFQNYYNAYSPKFSPDNRTIVFAAVGQDSRALGDVFAIDTNGKRLPRQLTHSVGAGSSYDPSYSPDGRNIVFVSAPVKYSAKRPDLGDYSDPELYLMKADGSHKTQIIQMNFNVRNPVFTNNGKHIIFLANPRNEGHFGLYQVNVYGGNLKQIATSRFL